MAVTFSSPSVECNLRSRIVFLVILVAVVVAPPPLHPPHHHPPHCHPPHTHVPPPTRERFHRILENELRCRCFKDQICLNRDAVVLIGVVLKEEYLCPGFSTPQFTSRGQSEIREIVKRGVSICNHHRRRHPPPPPHHHHRPPPPPHVHLPPHVLRDVIKVIECESYCFCGDYIPPTDGSDTTTAPEGLYGSCNDIYRAKPSSRSGFYNLSTPTEAQVEVYCLMGRNDFDEDGGWMRIAIVNRELDQASQPCPQDFLTNPDNGLCEKRANASFSSVFFTTYGVEYSMVCGRIIGLQFFSTDAFCPSLANCFEEDVPERFEKDLTSSSIATIDGIYVDGVSITHGREPRQHIFTLAAGLTESLPDEAFRNSMCPCSGDEDLSVVPTSLVPTFVGADYYCETGSRTSFQSVVYCKDPLWDGQGCGEDSSCCEGDIRPWFCKQLDGPTSDEVEVRIMLDSGPEDENVFLQEVLLYVQ